MSASRRATQGTKQAKSQSDVPAIVGMRGIQYRQDGKGGSGRSTVLEQLYQGTVDPPFQLLQVQLRIRITCNQVLASEVSLETLLSQAWWNSADGICATAASIRK